MRTFIWSYLYKIDGQYDATMLKLWYSHLRGPGQYQGDIYLVTNLQGIDLPGLKVIPVTHTIKTPVELYLLRIKDYDLLPWDQYDAGMSMDMDMLAVNDVTPLFSTDERLTVAASFFSVIHPKHAGFFMNPIKRLLFKTFSAYARQEGFNACCFSSRSQDRHKSLGRWKQLIERHAGQPLPPLGDQSFLNLAIWLDEFKVHMHPMDMITHAKWKESPQACLWHFPLGGQRLEVMLQHSKVEQSSGTG